MNKITIQIIHLKVDLQNLRKPKRTPDKLDLYVVLTN